MLYNLDYLYRKYNLISKVETQIQDSKFNIEVTKKDKTFNKFLAHFIATTTSLDFDKYYKISKLQRTITNCLR